MRPISYAHSRFVCAACWLFACAPVLAQRTAPAITAPSPIDFAQQAFAAGKYAEAATALQGALLQSPQSAPILYLLGIVQQRLNQPKASLSTFTHAASLAPPTAEQLRTVALDYILLADYTDAIHWLQRALQADPANAEAWYDLARAHMHEGSFQAAVTELQHSLALVPQSPKALDNLGVCFEAQNRPEDAMAAYERAIAVTVATAPLAEQPFLDFATLLNTRNDFSRARDLASRATAIAPGNSHGFEQLSRAYVGLQQLPQARAAMEQAVRLDSKNSRLHFQLGRIYRMAGQPDQAEVEFKRSAALYGQHSTD